VPPKPVEPFGRILNSWGRSRIPPASRFCGIKAVGVEVEGVCASVRRPSLLPLLWEGRSLGR